MPFKGRVPARRRRRERCSRLLAACAAVGPISGLCAPSCRAALCGRILRGNPRATRTLWGRLSLRKRDQVGVQVHVLGGSRPVSLRTRTCRLLTQSGRPRGVPPTGRWRAEGSSQ
eukprot:365998-Chlamydomonas_euryale.AAC.12